MAKVKGDDGVVKIGANTVASVSSFSLEESMDIIEDTDLGETAKGHVAGNTMWTAEIECKWDKAETTGQGAMTIGAEVALSLQPEGDVTGDETRSGNALVTARSASNEKGAMVTQTFSLTGNGALTVGAVA